MAAAEVMDGDVVRRWLRLAADALGATRSAIDLLNVFPVPDADTGTNLHATMASAAAALAGLPGQASAAEIWQAASAAALRDACGNSGIILSQVLRGLADTCGPAVPCDGKVVASALANAAALARAAVRRPVEGTVLSVADAAALAASQVTALADVGREAARGARLALALTERQLGALAAHRVVDAGGAGLCVVLDALHAAISGTHPGQFDVPAPGAGARQEGQPATDGDGSPHAYEVTFLIEATEPAIADLADALDQLGDSLVISAGPSECHVHVHSADAGAVIEAALAAGRPTKIKITFLNGHRSPLWPREPEPATKLVAVVEGAGLAALLRAAGATVVDTSQESSPAALLAELAAQPGPRILVGPPELARHWPDGWPVIQIESAIQAIAAVAVHDPAAGEADAGGLRVAAAGLRWAAVGNDVAASRLPGAGPAPAGPAPAGPAPAGPAPAGPAPAAGAGRGTGVRAGNTWQDEAAAAAIDRLITPETEMITIVTGLAARPGLGERAAAHVASIAPAVEVVCYDGGMTSAALLLGAE